MSTINEDLLAAAKEFLKDVEYDIPYQDSLLTLDKAIAAAERVLAERLKPIDADAVLAFGFVFNQAYQRYELRISSETRLNITPQLDYLTIYQGPVEAVGFELKNQGQLLDLLSGLGIEVKK